MEKTKTRRSYKDSLFRMVFREKKELLSLYNAINGTDYDDPEALTVTTIEDALYIRIKNDISFLIENVMNLYEEQSSWNPNMPLRGLFYFSNIYQGYVGQNHLDIYSRKQLRLPQPRYIVFYNGVKKEPDRQELRLSDSFIRSDGQPSLECIAQVININYGQNQELMEACKKLGEYSYFVAKVRENLKEGLTLETAVDRAVVSCIREDVLRSFLEKHRMEVKDVILTEFDEELHNKTLLEEGREEGKQVGTQSALICYLKKKGLLTKELEERILKEEELEVLEQWLGQAFDGKFPEDQERVEKHPLQEATSPLTEFDEELHNKTLLEEGREEGIRQERIAVLIRYLKKKRLLTKELEERILKEKDLKALEKWLDLAYDGASLEELTVTILKQ